jgi:phage terminase large subunit-like protein
MDAILPTITARRNAQIIYLSNAGDEDSVVLNDLRRRKDSDKRLAYLEWSAAEDRPLDDREGWAEANPALGVTISEETLEGWLASRPPASFETEHLCRWVISTRPRLVSEIAWQHCRGPVEPSRRPMLAISMDPSGTRASAVIAWQQSDGTVALRVVADVTGSPIDVDLLGPELRQAALRLGATSIAFDPWTDADLARHFKTAKPLAGRDYANASENFVRVIESGRLRWDDADQVTHDLAWTARKPHENGAWQAVKAKEDRPITAAFAAIRAVWLASGPKASIPKVL